MNCCGETEAVDSIWQRFSQIDLAIREIQFGPKGSTLMVAWLHS